MSNRILVLGAGFGGLELATTLSEALGDDVDVTLIDKSDAFVFGFSKLDVMFGRDDARRRSGCPTATSSSRACGSLQETITAIDPEARRVTTDAGVHEADVLVVALGADYDLDATPGPRRGRQRVLLGRRRRRGCARSSRRSPAGRAVVGVCGAPFKCPPAPSECALLLHDHLVARGVRDACEISFVMPFAARRSRRRRRPRRRCSTAFAERDIEFVAGRRVASLDPDRRRRRARRRQRDALRPLPRRPQAPRARRRDRERHDRGRLRPGRPARRSRRASPASTRSATSRRSACRRRACSPRAPRASSPQAADRRARAASDPPARLRRARLLLHRVRRRARRRASTSTSSPARSRPATFNPPSAALVAEKERVRLEPPRALVRRLSAAPAPLSPGGWRQRDGTRHCKASPDPSGDAKVAVRTSAARALSTLLGSLRKSQAHHETSIRVLFGSEFGALLARPGEDTAHGLASSWSRA